MVNISSFVGQLVFVTTTQSCCCRVKATIDSKGMGMAAFQYSFTYKSKQTARFGPWAIVGQPFNRTLFWSHVMFSDNFTMTFYISHREQKLKSQVPLQSLQDIAYLCKYVLSVNIILRVAFVIHPVKKPSVCLREITPSHYMDSGVALIV